MPKSMRHPGKMLPSIAATTIAAYTAPGEWGIDPKCGIGTTLVEATHLDRHAVGVEYEERWARLTVANLGHARKQGFRLRDEWWPGGFPAHRPTATGSGRAGGAGAHLTRTGRPRTGTSARGAEPELE
ncbi:DNA methyltransferase [Nonomuraea sp. NPDC003754]